MGSKETVGVLHVGFYYFPIGRLGYTGEKHSLDIRLDGSIHHVYNSIRSARWDAVVLLVDINLAVFGIESLNSEFKRHCHSSLKIERKWERTPRENRRKQRNRTTHTHSDPICSRSIVQGRSLLRHHPLNPSSVTMHSHRRFLSFAEIRKPETCITPVIVSLS